MNGFEAYDSVKAMFYEHDGANHESIVIKAILEALIDRFGLGTVLAELADVCDDKAAHIAENWQDEYSARKWKANSLDILKASMKA